MNMQTISNDMLVAEYGDRHDGIKVYKGHKTIGFLTDLRVLYSRADKKKFKQKEYNDKASEARREALPAAVEEMKEFLENQLVKFDAEIFINQTQPNVHLNGHKCYIIVDPIYGKHRLGVVHKTMDFSEMAEEVETCFKCTASEMSRHILISGMSQDDIVETIVKLCSHK